MMSYKLLCLSLLLAQSRYVLCLDCSSDQFACLRSDKCVDKSQRCNGFDDCTYGEDENDCDLYRCEQPNYFKCSSGDCIVSFFRCDGAKECDDGSDEEGCPSSHESFIDSTTPSSCTVGEEFTCTNNQCIPLSWACNGENDCQDGEDEEPHVCSELDKQCNPITDFLCSNHKCISKDLVCDGEDNCKDHSDEKHCPDHKTPCSLEHQMFQCKNNLQCIKLELLCNNHTDCSDGSDEGSRCHEACDPSCKKNCNQSPNGPLCHCLQGTKESATGTCVDIDECEEYGSCDQQCTNTFGSFVCHCDPGYTLYTDSRTCKANGGDTVLFYSTFNKVKSINLNSMEDTVISTNQNNVAGVFSDGSHVYWSSIYEGEEVIMKSLLDGTQLQMIVTSGLGSPEDIAVDWLTNNIYFTDNKEKHIAVCDNFGDHCAVVVSLGVDKPRGIALLPSERLMFWTDWGKKPMIVRSGMDGSNVKALVTANLGWPNDITVDYSTKRLFWVDADLKSIETVKLDGTDRRMILKNFVEHPFSISVFEDNIFWSDPESNEILTCNKYKCNEVSRVTKEKKGKVYGLSLYNPVLKHGSNPCENHPCSDLCLLAPNSEGFTCACPQEKSLKSNGRTCEAHGNKPAVVLGHGRTMIYIEHPMLGNQKIQEFHLTTSIQNIAALAYDMDSDAIFISDISLKKISQLSINSRQVIRIVKDSVGRVTAMAYDHLGKNLYWCDAERGTVEVFNMLNSARTVILEPENEMPFDIVLVPKEGFMFVAFLHDKRVHIDRIRMDGSLDQRTHVVEDDLIGPHISLHYDEDLERIFWADSFSGTIESTNIEGQDRFTYATVTSPMGIATVSNDLFWTSYQPDLMWGNKYHFQKFKRHPNFEVTEWNQMEYFRITAIKTSSFIAPNPCAQSYNEDMTFGGCSDICLLAGQSRVCACPTGKALAANGLTCEELPKCADESHFQCHNYHCISQSKVCNGIRDCPSGEDEDSKICPSLFHNDTFCSQDFKFLCGSGECISKTLLCDGHPFCQDGSDEDKNNCRNCTSDEFRCASGTCIPLSWRCDGRIDCKLDSTDEDGCHQICGPQFFKCNNDFCIPNTLRCDNKDDCGDRSDEHDCPFSSPVHIDSEQTQCLIPNFACTSDPTKCLPPSAKCNNVKDCPLGEDELTCRCGPTSFECLGASECVPKNSLCNGHNDCSDGSDEAQSICGIPPLTMNSSTTQRSASLLPCFEYTCDDGQCIHYNQVCNNKPDCLDHSDEGGRCESPCTSVSCEGRCKETPKGPICLCDKGFTLASNGRSCVDINECAIDNLCAQICTNTIGSYECSCVQPDFILESDQSTCKAIGTAMEIYYTTNYQLRKQHGSHLNILFEIPGVKFTGMDIDVRKNLIYWSGENGLVTQFDVKTLTRKLYISGLDSPGRLAVDWIRNIVYVVESERRIMACHFEKKSCVRVYYSIDYIHISALAVDPINGYLFWSETSWLMYDAPVGSIRRCDLTGGNVTTLAEQLSHVTSIAVNEIKQYIVWGDNARRNIGKIDYNGVYKQVIFDTPMPPLHVALFESNLYYMMEGENKPFGKCYLYGNMQDSCEKLDIHVPSSVSFFTVSQVSRQRTGTNKCHNFDCNGNMCLEGPTGPTCMCPDGSRVNPQYICSDDPFLGDRLDFKNHTLVATLGAGATGSGSFVLLMISFLLLILGVLVLYNFLLKPRMPNLVPKIHFRNPVFSVPTSFRNPLGRTNSTAHSILLPQSPLRSVHEPDSFSGKRMNEMTIKMNEDPWSAHRRYSDASTTSEYAEVQDIPKHSLL